MRALHALLFGGLLACSSTGDGAAAGGGSGAGTPGGGEGGAGDGGGGNGSGAGKPVHCPKENPQGPIVDLEWPAASNVGHDAVEGDTVRFHWTGLHNVVQVATFDGQLPPLDKYDDAKWPGEITSGAQTDGGTFDWNTGSAECGYRPGIYFFVDEKDPLGGVVSVSFTIAEGAHDAPRPCSDLARSDVYGGKYAEYADRKDCVVHEVDNFQTEAHFDWVPPILTAKQGDLVVYRWTGEHNVVQVHDASADVLLDGGVDSGDKTNCVGGPGYSCVDGAGEFVFDTTDFHPGIVHISDACAFTCTGHTTGMNMEVDLRRPGATNTPAKPVAGTCCARDATKTKGCRVVEIANANDGAQLDYNVPIGRGDIVRFSWAGSLRIYQSLPNADTSPSATPKPGGLAMPDAIECLPGPHETCLGKTEPVEFVFDVQAALDAGLAEMTEFGVPYFTFHAIGDAGGEGFTSADTGTLLYVDDSIPTDPTACGG